MLSKEEFLKRAEKRYESMVEAESHRDAIQYEINQALSQGFKVVVIGHEVRVTLEKEKSN